MMTETRPALIALAGLLLILLAGCAGQNARQSEQPKEDLFALRQKAAKAYAAGDMKESEKEYAELVKKVPQDADLWFRLGNVYASTQRPAAAVKAYHEALVRQPEMSKAWYNMGIMQLRQAVYSFSQLQVYSSTDDPLYSQSRHLIDGITDIIGGDDDKSGK